MIFTAFLAVFHQRLAVAVVGQKGLFVVVEIEPHGSGTDVLGLIVLIMRYAGAGVQIAPAVSVLVATETVAEHIFSASPALTLIFKSLSTSTISIGNGVPLSFGHSCNSR